MNDLRAQYRCSGCENCNAFPLGMRNKGLLLVIAFVSALSNFFVLTLDRRAALCFLRPRLHLSLMLGFGFLRALRGHFMPRS